MSDTSPAALAVSDSDLDALVRALRDGALAAPLTRTALQAAGFGHLVGSLEPYSSLDPDALRLLFEVVLAERRARRGPVVKVVWSGEDGLVSRARYTVVVVPELFTRARRHVLLAGYSFDRGAELFAPLHAVMRDHGVTVDLFLDLGQLEEALHAHALLVLFDAQMWPFGPPRPRIYYDPRTASPHARTSLHAKCLVVDHEVSLITSANFTDRGRTRNLEAGVLIEDRDLATSLEQQWAGLVEAGVVVTTAR
jgi:phosphatidylserine/phosphatidylglycerophosphate/cardiolipin synthase-like enzyme